MSVIQKADIGYNEGSRLGIPSAIKDVLRDAILRDVARRAWEWYDEHRDDVLVTRRVWFITVRIRVADLEWLFDALFGARV